MKILLFFILFFSSLLAAQDSSGWVSLQRPVPYVEKEGDDQQDIWVVFSKKIGKEKFLVRFPDDPVCLHSLEGMQISSSQKGERFHLFVQENENSSVFDQRVQKIQALPETTLIQAERVSSNTFDLLYQMEGKWVWERIFVTPNYVYTLQTCSDKFMVENHRIFFDSLYVEVLF